MVGLTNARPLRPPLVPLAALALLAVPHRGRRAKCPLVVPEVLLDQQEPFDVPVSLVGLIVLESLFELCIEGSVGLEVLRWIAICVELVQ